MIADLFTRDALMILAAFAAGSVAWWLVTWPARELDRRVIRAARALLVYMIGRHGRADRLDCDADLWRRVESLRAHMSEREGHYPTPRHSSGRIKR